ncbi:MAG: hypothetical protein A2V70_15200 [Planctomycetes bacterium RBG_13_63_9]|nr:MAG: hypothetical protein A2V70_15200 [Planctomycetes bacterium RBG_13_63_9]
MIYVLYSGDYEVFLGGNHRPESQVLIDRTEAIVATCGQIGVPATFFADVCCLWRYRELGYPDFPKQVDDQMCRAIAQGHDVQAHIHPHWMETEIDRNEQGGCRYRCDPSRFLLAHCVSGDGDQLYHFTLDLLNRTRTYLTDLLCPIVPQYRCIAFRAGGYGIQPGTEAIVAALEDAGFLIDSSVVPGMQLFSNVNCIDFTDVPQRGNYHISREHGLSRPAVEGVFEIPVLRGRVGVASAVRSKLRWLRHRWRRRTGPKPAGYAIQSTSARRAPLALRAWRFLSQREETLELSSDPKTMFDITRRYVRKYDSENEDLFFAFSFHPKSVDRVHLAALKQYDTYLKRYYGSSVRAITFQEAADRLAQQAS